MNDKREGLPLEFFIAGVQYHKLHTIINKLEERDAFELVLEPTNKFDPNAVRIEFNSSSEERIMCGYVPRKLSAQVAGMISIGKRLMCTIHTLAPKEKPWEQCKVKIEEVKADV